MKKFNIDKILLCFGIFFVSVFGVGLIDSHAETISEDEFNSYTNKYILVRKYQFNNGWDYDTTEIYGSDKPFYLPDNYSSLPSGSSYKFYDSDGNPLELELVYKSIATSNGTTKILYGKDTKTSFTKGTFVALNGERVPNDFDKYIVSSNFDLKTSSGKMVFQNNPLKEVKQVGEAVKNQTKVILPIAIFLMGCLLLVQILRRVLVRFSIG